MTARLHHGDCLDVLRTMPDASIDAIVTDPPYGLSFMGKRWDYDVPSVDIWRECLRVLKPGGHLLSFASTRTQHRMCGNIEDAGFEIRDLLAWVYGSGFPKSLNLKGDWQGWGTALKPAMEPITVARKPLIGTVVANVLKHGTAAMNIDGCRVGGRWPANLIHDGSDEVTELFPDVKGVVGARREGGDKEIFNGGGHRQGAKQKIVGGTKDNGSAARFFYCAKASRKDRGAENKHPTVKPTDLMRYLCRLVTPPNGTVLDPFMGSGSTGKAARLEGFRFIGIEREASYIEIAKARVPDAVSTARRKANPQRPKVRRIARP